MTISDSKSTNSMRPLCFDSPLMKKYRLWSGMDGSIQLIATSAAFLPGGHFHWRWHYDDIKSKQSRDGRLRCLRLWCKYDSVLHSKLFTIVLWSFVTRVDRWAEEIRVVVRTVSKPPIIKSSTSGHLYSLSSSSNNVNVLFCKVTTAWCCSLFLHYSCTWLYNQCLRWAFY